MYKDHSITQNNSLSKNRYNEQNHRLHSTETTSHAKKSESTNGISLNSSFFLTDIDHSCLSHIQDAYLYALQSNRSASSVISLDESLNKTFSYIDLIEIEKFIPIKLISFLRLIPEFESLCDQDRFALIKYNFLPLLILRDALIFDLNSDLLYDDTGSISISSKDEIFAQYHKSLNILFYGYKATQEYLSILRSIVNIIDNDRLIIQILMLVLIFLKGVSINDEQIWILFDPQNVLNAHLKYVDLLFRYLTDRFSFDIAVIKMIRLISDLFKVQKNAQDYREKLKKQDKIIELDPLMKSLIGVT